LDWQNLDAAAVLFLHTLLVDLIIQPADAAAVTKTFARLAGKEVIPHEALSHLHVSYVQSTTNSPHLFKRRI
jgi:hypothetical protein